MGTELPTLDFNINYEVPEIEKDPEYSNSRLTANYILYSVKQKYPEGLEGQRRRVWGRLQRKIDVVLADPEKASVVSLENAEVDFLRGLFTDETKFPATASKYVMLLEDAIAKI